MNKREGKKRVTTLKVRCSSLLLFTPSIAIVNYKLIKFQLKIRPRSQIHVNRSESQR